MGTFARSSSRRGRRRGGALRGARFGTALAALFALFLSVSGAMALPEEEISPGDWTVDAVRRLHSLVPLEGIDPWTLPFTRGDVARALGRLDASGPVLDPVARSYVDELRDEFAPELTEISERAGAIRIEPAFELMDHRRGALRGVLHGDLAARAGQHLAFHQRFEIDSRGGDEPDFLGSEWKKGITGRFTMAYGVARFGGFRFTAGRRRIAWGTGLEGTLILQGDAPPFDQVGLDGEIIPHVTLHAFVAPLDDVSAGDVTARRFLAAHRLAGRFWRDRIRVGLSETVVYGGENRAFDWAYANPLMVYYALDWNRAGDDDVFWAVDAEVKAHESVDLFAEFLADDFQYDRKTEPNQIALLAGARVKNVPRLPGIFVDAEYVRVNNWVYGHEMPWNRYTYGRANLGHPIGPDADRALVRLLWRAGRAFEVLGEYAHLREGEGSIDDPRDSAVPPGTAFLTGSVTTHDLPAFEIRYHPRANTRFYARAERGVNDEWIVSAGGMLRFAFTRDFGRSPALTSIRQ